jgi:hypothetical protein
METTSKAGKAERASYACRIFLVVGVLLVIYVGSYLFLTWRGSVFCAKYDCEGFVFANTRNALGEEIHCACFTIYRPLLFLERLAGTGRQPIDCILWGKQDVIAGEHESWLP